MVGLDHNDVKLHHVLSKVNLKFVNMRLVHSDRYGMPRLFPPPDHVHPQNGRSCLINKYHLHISHDYAVQTV